MGIWGLQINLKHSRGRDYKIRRTLKKMVARKRRRTPIEEDEVGGKGYLRCTYGWMY